MGTKAPTAPSVTVRRGKLALAISAVVAGAAVLVLVGHWAVTSASPATDRHPVGASSSRAAVEAFLRALERGDRDGMRRVMTTLAQENETAVGVLHKRPELTAFVIEGSEREDPRGDASPPGSVAALRYDVRMTPPDGFTNGDTDGSNFPILVTERRNKRWFVAEVGGGG